MLTVRASAKPSKVHGIGLVADEKIPKGTITWKYNKTFDLLFDPKDVESMLENQKRFIQNYAYLSMKTGKFVFSIDDSRFTNHSVNNNIDVVDMGESETCGVANRDIEPGEELLVNYRQFDVNDEKGSDEYLNR